MIKKINFSVKFNKNDWQIVTLFYTVYAVLLIFDFIQTGEIILDVCLYFISKIFFSLIIILTMIYWLVPQFIIKKKQLFLFFVFIILLLLFTGMGDYTVNYFIRGDDFDNFPNILKFIITSVFRLTDSAGLLLGVLLTKKYYESLFLISDIEKSRKENELKLLRNQLSPHFLFNNLNNLDALINKENKIAREYTNRLSNIYRYLIQTKDEDVIELQKELDFAENYIFLIKTRFKDSYSFNFENSFTDIETKFVPTGAIQTLIENVIKHNKTRLKTTVVTTINITDDYVTVKNTKTGIKSDVKSFGSGLENLQKRYTNINNKTILINDTENYFSVSVPILNLFD